MEINDYSKIMTINLYKMKFDEILWEISISGNAENIH